MKEKVLSFLGKERDALNITDIFDGLHLKTVEDERELEYVLNELVTGQEVYLTKKHKYILYANCPNFRMGKLQVNKSGNGFVILDKDKYNEDDIFIFKKNMGYAIDGDTVLVQITSENERRDKKKEGLVFKVLKRDIKNIVGVIESDRGVLCFKPNEDRNIILTIDEDSLKSCVEGEVVVVSILDDLGKNRYIGKVSKHIGHKDDPGVDILTIAAKYDIFADFPEEAMKQAEAMPNEVSGELLEEEKKIRQDLTKETIFTIDGEDTKDIDDAISLTYENGLYNLKVSIADVSHYVPEGSPLDLEAYNRGTSNYLAYSVIPMLPHKLSNGICSLNPGVIRCALTCDMKIDNKGIVRESHIYPSLIKSAKKMNYTSVNHLLEDNVIDSGYEEFAPILLQMQELAHLIRANRTKRGAADFGVDEPVIICNEEGRAIEVKAYRQGEGQKLIEDFMVIANETVANTLSKDKLPSVYRVHGTPKPEKIQKFIAFAQASGHEITGKFDDVTNPKMFQSLLKQVEGGDDANILKALAIRSMPKAYYSKDNIGHFGLAVMPKYGAYTHFTSPIRRYSDLQLHRLIWTYYINNMRDQKTISYWDNNLDAITKHISEREVGAIEAEREVDKMKMAEYMEQHIGEEFEGIISGVTGYGLFVQLDNLVEGLINVNSLDGMYEHMEDTECLIDSISKKRYRIGDKIKVVCVGANKETEQIDFEEAMVLKNEHQEEKGRSR